MNATILDTQDLATLRGGSLALLDLGCRAQKYLPGAEKIYAGASQAAFKVALPEGETAEDLRQRLAGVLSGSAASQDPLEKVLAHLRVVVDVVPLGEDGALAAVERAMAANRLRQMQELTLPYPSGVETQGLKACPVDRMRPGDGETTTEAGRWPRHKLRLENGGKTAVVAVSSSVAARRDYGMERGRWKRREKFYTKDLGLSEAPLITDDFLEMVQYGDRSRLPESLHNKMAVVYADGNGFGSLREVCAKAYGGDGGLSAFSEQVAGKRKALMQDLVDKLRERVKAVLGEESAKLPLETILWGADEMQWVLPAWLACDFVSGFFHLTRRDNQLNGPNGSPLPDCMLTHAVGVVTCDVKTPIRQVSALSRALADAAKAGGPKNTDLCQFEILESIDLPPDYLTRHRRTLFGAAPGAAFSLQGERWADAMAAAARLKEVFPRSQLYRLLRLAAHSGALRAATDDHAGVRQVLAELGRVLEREGYKDSHGPITAEDLTGWGQERFGAGASPLLPLAVLAQVWDYVAPMEGLPPLNWEQETAHD